MSKTELNGRCLCGAVTVSVSDPAGWLGVCHCTMCRRWSGALWAGFPAAASTVTVDGPVRSYASSAMTERAFCATCGSHLWVRDRASGSDYDLIPGLFEETADWPLKSEIYVDQAPAAINLAGDHNRATSEAYRAKNPQVRQIDA